MGCIYSCCGVIKVEEKQVNGEKRKSASNVSSLAVQTPKAPSTGASVLKEKKSIARNGKASGNGVAASTTKNPRPRTVDNNGNCKRTPKANMTSSPNDYGRSANESKAPVANISKIKMGPKYSTLSDFNTSINAKDSGVGSKSLLKTSNLMLKVSTPSTESENKNDSSGEGKSSVKEPRSLKVTKMTFKSKIVSIKRSNKRKVPKLKTGDTSRSVLSHSN